MRRTMIMGMVVGRVIAHSFLRNIDVNAPHETYMVSVSDRDSGFPMLGMTERQPEKTRSNINLALNRTNLVLFHAGTE